MGRIILGLLTLIGGIGYFIPPARDHEAWKKFAGIEMPNYPAIPAILSAYLGQSVANFIGLIILFVSIYVIYHPHTESKKAFEGIAISRRKTLHTKGWGQYVQ